MTESSDSLKKRFARSKWHGDGTVCGPGSSVANTEIFRKWLRTVLETYGVKRMNDSGCGDLTWVSEIDFAALGVDYLGYDVRENLDAPLPYEKLEIVYEPMRPCDLILCKDVFIHLETELVEKALENFRDACPGALFASTTFPGVDNTRTNMKGFAPLDLAASPFNLGTPLDKIESPIRRNKFLALWRIPR